MDDNNNTELSYDENTFKKMGKFISEAAYKEIKKHLVSYIHAGIFVVVGLILLYLLLKFVFGYDIFYEYFTIPFFTIFCWMFLIFSGSAIFVCGAAFILYNKEYVRLTKYNQKKKRKS